jgi:hypothetical protein
MKDSKPALRYIVIVSVIHSTEWDRNRVNTKVQQVKINFKSYSLEDLFGTSFMISKENC